jgi:L-alanine-DL-glutamate epimerase-like enolase superfamily enzyme
VYIRLESQGFTGYGEAAFPPYVGETTDSVVSFIRSATSILSAAEVPFLPGKIIPAIDAIVPGNAAAKAGIDLALYDLLARSQQKSVHELLGLQKPQPKETSVTISIGDTALIPQKLEELKEFSLLKIKLGGGDDKKNIEAIRKYSHKPMVVDVNQGWNDKQAALNMVLWLADQNVLYIEQPLPKERFSDMAWLSEKSPIPILADESFQRFADLEKIQQSFSGINLKLMKCTGLLEGSMIIRKAKENGLKVNIGCMSESSCGIAAAAQLMAYADWIDLDGPMLINNDPFTGITFSEGKLILSNSTGTGATPQEEKLGFIPA